MNIFTQFFSKSAKKDPLPPLQEIMNDLVRRQPTLARSIFGEVSQGGSREFFCLDETTWIWHESWKDETGYHTKRTKYEIREDDIVKSVNEGNYQSVSMEEATNLRNAVRLYTKRVNEELYAEPVAQN